MTKPYAMKYVIWILFLMSSFLIVNAQEIQKQLEINSDDRLVSSSLPFDKPFKIKYTLSNKAAVYGVGLIEVSRKERPYYYTRIMTQRALWDNAILVKESQEDPSNRIYWRQSSNEKTTELYISVNPLAPARFYDFLIVRYPTINELELYFELFKIVSDNKFDTDTTRYLKDKGQIFRKNPGYPLFESTLIKINSIKVPFDHIAFDGPDDGKLDVYHLIKFYNQYLGNDFIAWENEVDGSKRLIIKKRILDSISGFDVPIRKEDQWPDFKFGESIRATSVNFSFDTRTTLTLTPDFGYVYYGFSEKFYGLAPYIGAQIEFRYFDKNIPFNLIHKKSIWHRLSFTTGITLTSLKKDKQREDFFSNKSLITGIGLRLSSAVRITTGVVLFNRLDPNPILDNKRLSATPFIGLSVDLKLKSLMGDASAIFGLSPSNTN